MKKGFYLSVWRWHFFAGLYVIPFMLMLAVTGMIMLASPWIDQWQYGEQLTTVEQQEQYLPLDSQLKAVSQAYPELKVAEFIPPVNAEQSSLFKLKGDDSGTLMVFVNPYSGDILGEFKNQDRIYTLMDEIHGTLLIGETGDFLIELAAGFGILLLITGLYLHWPTDKSARLAMLIPAFILPAIWKKTTSSKRSAWKQIHSSLGFYASLFLLFFLLTGMAWTGIWGAKLVQPWSSFPAEKKAKHWQSEQLTHSSLNTDQLNEVAWNLEQTPLPVSVDSAKDNSRTSLQSVYEQALAMGFVINDRGIFSDRFRIALPKDDTGVYSIMSVTMSRDMTDPTGDRTVHIDQYSGRVLADIGWQDYSPVAKTMAAGIAFHMGSAGWWNLILAFLACLMFLVLAITGALLWWKRKPSGKSIQLAAPPGQTFARTPNKTLVLLMLLTGALFPVSGAAMLIFLLIEWPGRQKATESPNPA